MYVVRKLRLYGFKSFPKETTIEFSRGLTGIVGPNGCGKSNIADALMWVMGEQSPKTLRGGAMEDVVFNGSDRLAPMGMAEVELQLENLDPAEGEERFLTIQRKYFREGDGQYRINGKRCRRKDIQEKLFELGLGSKSYAIIEQGRVSTLINSRPEDRRFMIEDAAGILKYKMKKKEAESKIRLTRENLERVEDIIAEVKRSLNSLRQQAARARQFKTIQDELREKKGRWLGHRMWEFEQKIGELDRMKNSLQDRFATAAAERARLEHRMEQHKQTILEREEEVSRLSREYFDKKLRSERLEAEIRHAETKLTELKQRLEGYEGQFSRMQQELESLADSRRGEEQNRDMVREDLENLLIRQEEVADRLQDMREELEVRQSDFQEVDLELKELERRYNRRSSEVTFMKKTMEDLTRDIDGRQAIVGAIETEIQAISDRIAEGESSARDLADRLDVLEEEAERTADELADARRDLADLKDEMKRMDIEAASLENHMAAMTRFLDSREGFSENVKRIMEAHPDLVAGVLGDFIESDGELDMALESFFSGLYQVIVPVSAEALDRLVAATREQGLGGVAFLVPDGGGDALPAGGLLDHLTWTRPVPEELLRYLAGIEVKNEADVRDRSHSYITKDGMYFLADTGILTVGGREDQGFFSIKTGLRESEKKLAVLNTRRKETGERMEALETRVVLLEERQSDIRSQMDTVRVDLSAGRTSLESDRSLLASKEADVKRITSEIAEKTERVNVLRHDMESVTGELAKLEEEITARMDTRRMRERQVEDLRIELETVNEEFNDLKVLGEKRQATVASIEKELQFLDRREKEIRETLEQTRRNRETDLENRKVLESHIARNREQADQVVDDYRSIDAVLAEKKRALEDLRRELALLENELAEMRSRENGLKEEEQQLALRRVQIEGEIQHLNTQLNDLPGDAPPPDPVPVEEPERLANEVERLEKRMQSFGAVNLLAIEECAEHEERYEFLTAQREDLQKSLSNLTRDIRDIDATTKDLFLAAFHAINATFSDVFQRLFGGGSAKLSLTDPDDPLETGVEIFAQPPGKKIQSITLMSGGEKALTALALLFAVFEYRISPLCVLDEVDAPLDEANVIQLGQFLRRYGDQVQFVIVTHNKTTMEMVDYLYGVTMEEPGCSKIVSVRLEDRSGF